MSLASGPISRICHHLKHLRFCFSTFLYKGGLPLQHSLLLSFQLLPVKPDLLATDCSNSRRICCQLLLLLLWLFEQPQVLPLLQILLRHLGLLAGTQLVFNLDNIGLCSFHCNGRFLFILRFHFFGFCFGRWLSNFCIADNLSNSSTTNTF